MIKQVKTYLLNLQADICQQLTQTDGKAEFIKDTWEKDNSSGSGITRVLKNGRVFEQAGVNFSIIYGNNLPKSATQLRPELAGRRFSALGVSVVVHPQNPYVPTSHMNVRFFIATKDGEPPIWWFGGGFDLTPFYGFDEDCIFWHQNAKNACDPFGKKLHPKYKKWCDEYFYMPHRDEQRGIGGLFFDDFNQGSFSECFAFMQSIGNSYINAYLPIVEKRKDTLFSENQRQFQLYRRGRYVEFNLIYDRGTLFGLQTGGRTESILMSLPPKAAWQYQFLPKTNSQEQKLTAYFLKPQNWLSEAQSQR